MSRSSKGFADFFPTAPSVLQQKRSKASQERRKPHSPSPSQSHNSQTLASHSAGSYGEATGATFLNRTSSGSANTMVRSLTHEESECVNADISHEIGSASSTSTSSSVFSAGHRDANMASHHRAHHTTSVTPLTNVDSSPRANGSNSPQKRLLRDNHLSARDLPLSPELDHRENSVSLKFGDVLTPYVQTRESTPLPIRPQARPPKGQIKGFKAIYDPHLDKKLRGEEKKGRQVKFEPFGEEVSINVLPP